MELQLAGSGSDGTLEQSVTRWSSWKNFLNFSAAPGAVQKRKSGFRPADPREEAELADIRPHIHHRIIFNDLMIVSCSHVGDMPCMRALTVISRWHDLAAFNHLCIAYGVLPGEEGVASASA